VLNIIATVFLFYPLLLAISLYAEWLLAWSLLSHKPVPSMDDPKSISGNWMHWIVGPFLLGAAPAIVGAVVFNILHAVLNRARQRDLVVRGAILALLWAGLLVLLRADPGRVAEWWMD
jgi:hypothetical protein